MSGQSRINLVIVAGGSPRSMSPLGPEDELNEPSTSAPSASTATPSKWWFSGSGRKSTAAGDTKKESGSDKQDDKKSLDGIKKSPLETLLDSVPG